MDESLGARWMMHMRRGDFEAAWRLSDFVLRARRGQCCSHLPRHLQWVWDGRSLTGKRVLIRCYHGLGDTVQFIRYARLVKSIAKEVLVLAQGELLPLLSSIEAIDGLAALEAGDTGLCYDVDVEVMELPHVFRTTPENIPAGVPYIYANHPLNANPPSAKRQALSSARQNGIVDVAAHSGSDSGRENQGDAITPRAARSPAQDKMRVGIVWAAGDWDPRRSVPVGLLAPLAELPGVELQVFQVGAALAEPREWRAVIPQWKDIVTEADLLAMLDLMITVDSLPAHLVGALGIPVWTLLHKDADWRWMESRADSPWYPTMRLLRQQQAGDWRPVIVAVTNELRELSRRRDQLPGQPARFTPQFNRGGTAENTAGNTLILHRHLPRRTSA
jgi:hypothetical protein